MRSASHRKQGWEDHGQRLVDRGDVVELLLDDLLALLLHVGAQVGALEHRHQDLLDDPVAGGAEAPHRHHHPFHGRYLES